MDSDLKKHGWKLVAIVLIIGIAGAMSYDDELKHEIHAPVYYNALNDRYERDYSQQYAKLRAQDAADAHAKEVLLGYAHTESKTELEK